MFFEIIFIFLCYGALMVIVTYYVNLYLAKDQYSKGELKNISPFLLQLWNVFLNKYSFVQLIFVMLGTAFVGTIIPLLSGGWIVNSALIFVAVYFAVPFIRQSFEKTQVMASEEYSDNVVNLFVKYSDVGVFSFGAGYGSALIYSWATIDSIYFLWFFINIVIVSTLMTVLLKKMIKEI
jgi:hypothetical protein